VLLASFAESEQVEIARCPVRVAGPDGEERGTLEHESAGSKATPARLLYDLNKRGVGIVGYGTSSTVITTQLEPKNWHPIIGDETIADAVCGRLVHNAHKVKLGGESIRKTSADLTKGQKPAK
jgi:hypothetical protein